MCGDFPSNDEKLVVLTQEVDIQLKTHAEGMHAGAAGNKKTCACLISVQEGETKETGAKLSGDSNLPAEDHRHRQTVEPARQGKFRHPCSRLDGPDFSPPRTDFALYSPYVRIKAKSADLPARLASFDAR
jgi:hypothetical protein